VARSLKGISHGEVDEAGTDTKADRKVWQERHFRRPSALKKDYRSSVHVLKLPVLDRKMRGDC
jgi:hypothetical protein